MLGGGTSEVVMSNPVAANAGKDSTSYKGYTANVNAWMTRLAYKFPDVSLDTEYGDVTKKNGWVGAVARQSLTNQ